MQAGAGQDTDKCCDAKEDVESLYKTISDLRKQASCLRVLPRTSQGSELGTRDRRESSSLGVARAQSQWLGWRVAH